MAQAENGDTVKIRYTGKLEDGGVFCSSSNQGPMQFKLAEGLVIRGFEETAVGMSPGESTSTAIPPEEGFGPHHDQMVQVIDRKRPRTRNEMLVGNWKSVDQRVKQC